MSKLSFRARALDASKPMPIYLAEELPDLPDYSAINRAVPQMPSGMEKEEESEHHLQRAISGTGLIIPTPEVCPVSDLHFYERCYPPDYKMPKQHIHMQPLWEEQEMPEYDMDSEDERWLRQQRHPDLTELLFEQMMDRLEKSSGQTVVTLSEAKLLLQRADDLVIAVYDYWLNKRLTTQHPLILSVKTESRPGQSTNNPYLAFRRRTEKMQTRKNRKNDESSYEKMLKLRRELARALALLQLVAKREQAKRELVALTGAVAERRHRARDYTEPPPPPPPPPALHLSPAPPTASLPAQTTHSHHRTVYAPTSFRREPFTVQQFAPPIESRQKTLLSQREKRPYKRRKHRHHPVGAAAPAREGGASSSSEDSGGRDDSGPFAFRRRQGCYYQLPTSTLCGEPVPGTDLFEHELDPRHRYTLVSVSEGCVGFARRRVGRGGRCVLDRHTTPLDSLWAALPPPHVPPQEEPSDTIRYRSPKETWRDHTHSRYPWRKAFRRHLASHSHLWIDHVKGDTDDVTNVFDDVKLDLDDVKVDLDDIKMEIEESKSDMEKPSLPQDAVRWGGRGKAHAWDVAARAALRKRVHSASDSSVDEQEPLAPVEREFSQFINEVNNEWLHFRPRSPPPPPPVPRSPSPPLPPAEPFAVELFPQLGGDGTLAPFCTDTLTLQRLQGTPVTDEPTPPSSSDSAYTVRVRDCTPPPLPRPPARTPPPPPPHQPPVPPPTVTAPAATAPASTAATNTAPTKSAAPQAPKPQTPPKKAPPTTNDHEEKRDRSQKVDRPVPSTVPNSNIVVGANEVPHQIKVDKKKPAETIEEVIAVAGGVQLKTVQSVHSPLKKHIISARPPPPPAPAPRPSDTQTHTQAQAQSRPVPHDHLKVRLQNHLVTSGGCVVAHTPGLSVSSEAGSSGTVVGLINAPSVPNRRQHHTVASVASVSVSGAGIVGGGGGRRAPIVRPVQLAPSPAPPPNSTTPVVLSASHTIHHVAPNKLKVLHAHPLHPLTHTQAHAHPHRNHLNLLGGRGSIAQLPAVVSLGGGQALIKGSNALTQFIEIKGAPLGKGPHLVNVVRTAPAPTAPTSAPPASAPPAPAPAQQPLVCTDNKRRQLVFDTTRTALKGNIQAVSRGHRVSVPVEGRGGSVPVASIAGVRAPHVRHQIHLKGRTLVGGAAPSTKTAALSQAVVANLLHKNVQLPKGGQKIAIGSAYSGASVAGMGSVVGTMGGSVQTLTLSGAHLKARVHTPSPSHTHHIEVAEGGGETASTSGTNNTDGTDTHRNNDTLPMEVT